MFSAFKAMRSCTTGATLTVRPVAGDCIATTVCGRMATPLLAKVAVACFIWHPNYLVLPAFEDAVPGRVVARHPAERQAYILQDEVVLCDA